MGATSARKALAILANTENVLSIEALAAAQALDYRAPLRPAPRTQAVHAAIRAVSPTLVDDRALAVDIPEVRALLQGGALGAPLGS